MYVVLIKYRLNLPTDVNIGTFPETASQTMYHFTVS